MKKITFNSIINVIMFLYIISLYIFTYRENLNIISNVLALILVFMIWTNILFTKKRIIFNYYLFIHLLFIIVCTFSVLFAIDQGIAISKVRTLVLIYLPMIALVNYVDSFKKLKILIVSFIYAGFFTSVYILITSDFSQLKRYGSELGNVNVIGMIIGISVTFCFFSIIEEKKYRYSLLLLIMLATVLLTGSRKALLLIIMNIIIILYLNNKKGLKKKLKFFVISMAFLLVCFYLIFEIPLFYQIIGRRIENLFVFALGGDVNEGSVYTRAYMIEVGLKMFKERPIIGHGINNYKILFSGVIGGRETYSHNNIIELMVGTGLIGVLLYYLSNFVVVQILFTASRISKHKMVCYTFIAIIVSYTILSVALVYYDSKHYSFLLAAASVIGRIAILDKEDCIKPIMVDT